MMCRIFLSDMELRLLKYRYGDGCLVFETCNKLSISSSEYYRMFDAIMNKLLIASAYCSDEKVKLHDIKVLLEEYIYENESVCNS